MAFKKTTVTLALADSPRTKLEDASMHEIEAYDAGRLAVHRPIKHFDDKNGELTLNENGGWIITSKSCGMAARRFHDGEKPLPEIIKIAKELNERGGDDWNKVPTDKAAMSRLKNIVMEVAYA